MASPIRIIPPIISKYFVGKFLNKYPLQNPNNELTKVIIPIKIAENQIFTCEKQRDIPAPNASILVAIANINKQLMEIQQIVFSFSSKASLINFIPKTKNIKKTIQLFINSKYLYIPNAQKYPKTGIKN